MFVITYTTYGDEDETVSVFRNLLLVNKRFISFYGINDLYAIFVYVQ